MNICDRCKQEIYDFERGLDYPFSPRSHLEEGMDVAAAKQGLNSLWAWRWNFENHDLIAGHNPWKVTEDKLQSVAMFLAILQQKGHITEEKADALRHNLFSRDKEVVDKYFTKKNAT